MTFTPLAKRLIVISTILGTLMSAYLSYQNYWGGGCKKAWLSCGVGDTKVLIFGQPTCVYGFGFFLITLILMLLAWKKQTAGGWVKTITLLGLAGILFSGSVGVYEIFWLKALEKGSLPACVYGFVFFAVVFIAGIQSWIAKPAAMTTPPITPPTPTL